MAQGLCVLSLTVFLRGSEAIHLWYSRGWSESQQGRRKDVLLSTRTCSWCWFLVYMLAGICSAYGDGEWSNEIPSPLKQRFNFVLLLTDDQRWDTLWAMPIVQEKLIARGVTFT